jgi:general secretion pathway protein D
MFNFSDAGLPELVRAISEVTGKRFIVTGNLPALKATLYSPDPITADEAYQAFLGVLASNGLTVVPRGRFLVISPSPGFGRGR